MARGTATPVDDPQAVVAMSPDGEQARQALIREARQRQRRRRLVVAVVALAAVSLVTALSAILGTGGSVATHRAGPGLPDRVQVSTVPLGSSIDPTQVVSAGGAIWLTGWRTSLGGPCALERLDPVTLHTQVLPAPGCASYVAATARTIDAAVISPVAVGRWQFRLEQVDAATGRVVIRPSVVTTTEGTGYAHMGMAAAGAWVWLVPWGSVLQISVSTGAVVRRVDGVAANGGGHPAVVAEAGGLWVGGGPGDTTGAVWHVPADGGRVTEVQAGPRGRSAVLWLAAADGRVWADVAVYRQRDGESDGQLSSTHLVAFDRSGHRVLESPPEVVGDLPPVSLDGALWTIGSGRSCRGPQHLFRIDPATGRSSALTTLATPVEACLAYGPDQSQLAVAAGRLFLLERGSSSGVLYRIRPITRQPTGVP